MGEDKTIYKKDYDGRIDTVPVSDPNISSNAHRMTLAQTRLEVAARFPQVVNLREAIKQYFVSMGQEQDLELLIPPEEEAQQQDPVSDILTAVNGKPIKAFPGQDHTAHIQVKQLWLQDPQNGKDPLMQPVLPVIVANIREHMMARYAELMQSQNPQDEAAMVLAAQKVAATNLEEAAKLGSNDPLMVAAKAELLQAETDAKKLCLNVNLTQPNLVWKLRSLLWQKEKKLTDKLKLLRMLVRTWLCLQPTVLLN